MARIPFRILAPAALLASLGAVGTTLPGAAERTGAANDAVLLEETLQIDIRSESEAVVRFSNRTQVLTEAGIEVYAHPFIPYTPSIEIRQVSAFSTSPTGKRSDVKKPMISDDAAFQSFELYSDSRQRTIHFPGVVPGAILEYHYEEGVKNLTSLPDMFLFQEEIPAKLKTLTIRYPASYPLKIAGRPGVPEPRREESGGSITLRWEGHDLPPYHYESGMPPWLDVVPAVQILPGKMTYGGVELNADSWEGIARWYWGLAKDRMDPSPAVKKLAAELAAPGNDPGATLERLFEFAQKKVSYVAVELGAGGFQPHANEEVFLHRYGDCKDKATLLIAMLRSVGLRGYPVLIRTRDEGLMDRNFPSIAFNHVIVAIPREQGYLFLDPTSESTPLGELPWQDQGTLVLVVRDGGDGQLVETPLAAPESNRSQRKVEGGLALVGDLEGTYTMDSWGSGKNSMESFQASASSSERPELIQDLMGWLCPGAVIQAHEMVPPKGPADPFRINVTFRVPRMVSRSGSLQILNPHIARFPFLVGLSARTSRTYPIFFDELFLENAEARIALPPEMTVKQVPGVKKFEGPGLEARYEYELARAETSRALIIRSSLRVSQREIPAADFPAVKQFLDSMAREEATAVTLVPAD